MQTKVPSNQLRIFWLQWLGVNIFCFVIGRILYEILFDIYCALNPLPPGFMTYIMSILDIIQLSLIFGLSFGLVVGIGQWLVLRRWIHNFKYWIIINALSWFLARPVSTIFFDLWHDFGIEMLMFGLVIGCIQWVALRKYFDYSIWWIVIWVICGYPLWVINIGWMLDQPFYYDAIAGGIIGIITGSFLVFLLTHPRTTLIKASSISNSGTF